MTDTAEANAATGLRDLPRDWRGRIETGGRSLRVRLHLPPAGETAGTFDHVDAGVMSIPVEGITWDGDVVRAESAEGPIELELDGDVLRGHHDGPHGRSVIALSCAPDAYLADVTPRLSAVGKPVREFTVSRPRTLDDGWKVSPDASAHVDLKPLLTMGTRILDETYAHVDDVLIAREGELLFEEYFFARRPEQLHTIQSCTKAVTALVFGLAVDHGDIRSLDDPVWRYLDGRTGTRWVDERYDVTVHQLLSMSAGLEWNEEVHYTDPANDNTRMNRSGDWIGYVLDRPRQADFPRGRYEYQSGLTLLIGEVLRSATGRAVTELARDELFAPLQITDFHWYAAPDGTVHTGGGLALRPRDLLKLGSLVLRGGTWNGRRVLSSAWIERITTEQSSDEHHSYGYQWFRGTTQAGDAAIPWMEALGYGGQSLHVLPSLDAVVVSNATDYFADGSYLTILEQHAVPALMRVDRA